MVLKDLNFNSFSLWEGMVVLKDLNSFSLGGCFLNLISDLWKGVVVLKELIFNS